MDIVWSARARRDRDEIHARIARARGPARANQMLAHIVAELERIAQFPEACRVRTDRGDRDKPMLTAPYVIRYRYAPRAHRVRIMRIYHARQQRE